MIIVGNMKMKLNYNDICTYLNKLNNVSKNVIICPSPIFTPYFLNHNFSVGLQNCFYEKSGAFTGEISPLEAYRMGVTYTIIGHSERRTIFKENDIIINKKIKTSLDSNLNVILCVTDKYKKELKKDLKEIKNYQNIIIAYEPLSSIGTGKAMNNNDIIKTISNIKKILPNNKVLYGGSVNEQNINELIKTNVDGFLVGGASVEIDKFLKIIEVVVNQ